MTASSGSADTAACAANPDFTDSTAIADPTESAANEAMHATDQWAGRERCVVAATGADAATHLLCAWNAWRQTEPTRCRLTLIAIAAEFAHTAAWRRAVCEAAPDLAERLHAARPALVPISVSDLHSLTFDAGRVTWFFVPHAAPQALTRISARVDAWRLGADAANWESRAFKGVARLSAMHASLVAPVLPAAGRRALASAGFVLDPDPPEPGAGTGHPAAAAAGSVSVSPTTARYSPRPTVRPHAGRTGTSAPAREGSRVVIVGAGLAGCASAWALAEHGVCCTVIERQRGVAMEASGNPAGIYHGVVHARDAPHARFNRAAALHAHDAVRIAIERHGVAGATSGLLRLETSLGVTTMRARLTELGLPPTQVDALSAHEASARAGLPLSSPAWFHAVGGWIEPAGLARSFLARAGALAELRPAAHVDRVEPGATGWRLMGADGEVIDEARWVVLANAADAFRLLDDPDAPVEAVRGQLSMVDAHGIAWTLPRLPVVGTGYVLPSVRGKLVFGASSHAGDPDADVRASDHAANLARLDALIGHPAGIALDRIAGRTAWRCTSRDRLPWIGSAPDRTAAASRLALHGDGESLRGMEHARHVPRLPGLFVFTALGSRGITWSALGARVLAALVCGAPVPLDNGLLDAVDPARFVARGARSARGAAR